MTSTYTPPQTKTLRPLSAAERSPLVDALRGVAILGVLVAYTLWNLGSPPQDTWSPLDRIINQTSELLVDAKFLTIFAFLFGVGTAQQWRRFESLGLDTTRLHLRRMLFLLVAGLLHATLLRNGDILAPYAILGIVLLAARRRSNGQLIAAAIVLALLPYGILALLHSTGWKLADRPAGGGTHWWRYWSENLAWLRYWYLTNTLISWPRVLAIMLAGVVAERDGLLSRLGVDGRFAWRTLGIATGIALAAWTTPFLLSSSPTFLQGLVASQLYHLFAWSLATVYACAFALICQRPEWPARLSWLRAVGRMAFSNYLLQALIVVPVCLAFGLFDAVTPTRGLLLALAVMAIEIPFSVWWLCRFQYGPVEWLWRTVTYGRIRELTRSI